MEDDVEQEGRNRGDLDEEEYGVRMGEGHRMRQKAASGCSIAVGLTVAALAVIALLGLLVCPFVLHFEGDSHVWPYDESELVNTVEDPSDPSNSVEIRHLLTREYHANLNYTFWNSAKGESLDHAMSRVFQAFRKATGLDISGDSPVERSYVRLEVVHRGVHSQVGYDLVGCTAYDFEPPAWCEDYSEPASGYDGKDTSECSPSTSIELRVRRVEATMLPEGPADGNGVVVELRSIDNDQRVAVRRNFLPIFDAASPCDAEQQQAVFHDCSRQYTNQVQISHVSNSISFDTCKDVLLYFPNCFDRGNEPFDSEQRNNEVQVKSSGLAHVVWEDIREGLDKRSGVRFRFSTTFEFPTVEDAVNQVNQNLAGEVVMSIFSPGDGEEPWNEVLNVMVEAWYTQLLAELTDDAFLPC